jgi:hypothetical protein
MHFLSELALVLLSQQNAWKNGFTSNSINTMYNKTLLTTDLCSHDLFTRFHIQYQHMIFKQRTCRGGRSVELQRNFFWQHCPLVQIHLNELSIAARGVQPGESFLNYDMYTIRSFVPCLVYCPSESLLVGRTSKSLLFHILIACLGLVALVQTSAFPVHEQGMRPVTWRDSA